MPLAKLKPWPNGPVEASIPLHLSLSGCPCKQLPSFLKVFSLVIGKYPLLAKHEYKAGQAWPLLNTNLSLSTQLGFLGLCLMLWKYNTPIISVADTLPPGWPLPA